MTSAELKNAMVDEIEALKNVPSKFDASGILTEESVLSLFYILNKYTTFFKICEDEESFQKRISLLKSGNDEEYKKSRDEYDLEEQKKIDVVQKEIFEGFGCSENDYMQGYQRCSTKPEFVRKMQVLQHKVVEEVQSANNVDLPEGLTKEKAQEIRDFAKQKTQSIVMGLQRTETDQQVFNQKFMFEVSKLDDVIYMNYGYKNTDVLKAFQTYNLIPKQPQQNPMGM